MQRRRGRNICLAVSVYSSAAATSRARLIAICRLIRSDYRHWSMNYSNNDSRASTTRRPLWLARMLISVAAGLGLWFLTQWLIGTRPATPLGEGEIPTVSSGDILFRLTKPVNAYLQEHPTSRHTTNHQFRRDRRPRHLADRRIDFRLDHAPVPGPVDPFRIATAFRRSAFFPLRRNDIAYPGVPSLLVTYQVANDFFFSGHTAIAVFGGLQLAALERPWWLAPGLFIAFFEMATVIVLRAHYSIDVFTGAIAALWASSAAA